LLGWLHRVFFRAGAEPTDPPDLKFDEDVRLKYGEAKQRGLEEALGPMHDLVGHAIIPFEIGGPVDMYYFPNVLPGTAFVTQELIDPDGTGPKPSEIGTYELIAFTRHPPPPDMATEGRQQTDFDRVELRMRNIFTRLANYAHDAVLKPHETCEVPDVDGETPAIVFDEFKPVRGEFRIDGRKHGLLLCIEVYPSELELARKSGSKTLLRNLMDAGHYPYSDLNRASVA
jgi:hypothetical protein